MAQVTDGCEQPECCNDCNAVAVSARANRMANGDWNLAVTCPYCQEKHIHNGGGLIKPKGGTRIAHCSVGESKALIYCIGAIEIIKNHNQCACCIEEEGIFPVPHHALADSGMCGQCGKIDEVFDMGLINLYFRRGFSIEFVRKYLPRLRLPLSHPNTTPSYTKWWARPGHAVNRGLSMMANQLVRSLATIWLEKMTAANDAHIVGEHDLAAEHRSEAERIEAALRADGQDIREFVSLEKKD